MSLLLMTCNRELIKLTSELKAYREVLPSKQKDNFDETWGLDSQTGDFLSGARGGFFNMVMNQLSKVEEKGIAETVLNELVTIRQGLVSLPIVLTSTVRLVWCFSSFRFDSDLLEFNSHSSTQLSSLLILSHLFLVSFLVPVILS